MNLAKMPLSELQRISFLVNKFGTKLKICYNANEIKEEIEARIIIAREKVMSRLSYEIQDEFNNLCVETDGNFGEMVRVVKKCNNCKKIHDCECNVQ